MMKKMLTPVIDYAAFKEFVELMKKERNKNLHHLSAQAGDA